MKDSSLKHALALLTFVGTCSRALGAATAPLQPTDPEAKAVVDRLLAPAVNFDGNDWRAQMACIVDMSNESNPSPINEGDCAKQVDSDSNPCVWCSLTVVSGGGVCTTPGQKDSAGQLWDSMCAAEGSDGDGSSIENKVLESAVYGWWPWSSDDTPAPVTPRPTSFPTPKPTLRTPAPTPKPTPKQPDPPAPVPTPDDSGNDDGAIPDWSEEFDCTTDSSSNIISDESACTSQVDPASSSKVACVWCPISLLGAGGGLCISNDANDIAGAFACSGAKGSTVLRGSAWKELDTSCLTGMSLPGGGSGDSDDCVAKTDSDGASCVWCDGAGVFGLCVSSSQSDAASEYMECSNTMLPVAVE